MFTLTFEHLTIYVWNVPPVLLTFNTLLLHKVQEWVKINAKLGLRGTNVRIFKLQQYACSTDKYQLHLYLVDTKN